MLSKRNPTLFIKQKVTYRLPSKHRRDIKNKTLKISRLNTIIVFRIILSTFECLTYSWGRRELDV